MEKGMIDHCKDSGCGWACCNYGQDGHIIMLPGEYENADAVDHLEILDDDYNGGKKAKCKAVDTSNCDGGYKPFQCAIYPLWIRSDFTLEKSRRCPLTLDQLSGHMETAANLLPSDVDPISLDKAELNSYDKID